MTEAKGPRRLLGLRRTDPSHGNHKQQQHQQQSSSRRNPRVTAAVGELDAAPRLSPASPGTPPRKLWEMQYRNFLSSKGKDPAMPVPPVLPPPPAGGGATAALLKQKQQAEAASASGSHHCQVRSETSVRGGKLFGQIFRNGNGSTTTLTTPPVRRRVKSLSADELGGTMRKGVERRHSPPAPDLPARCVSASALQQHFGQTANAGPLRPRIATEEDSNYAFDDWTFTDNSSERSERSLTHQIMMGSINIGTETIVTLPEQQGTAVVNGGVQLETASAMKKAFTEFHNSQDSGSDAVSAYLGDDSSLRDLDWFNGTRKFTRTTSFASIMPQVKEGVPQTVNEERILRPVLGTETWQTGRRYLIGQAALAACPTSVADAMAAKHAAPAATATDDTSRFGTVILGSCQMCYGGPDRNIEDQVWSLAQLVLKQNYLLEYDATAGATVPRGYAHLQYAVAYPHAHFADMVELHFFGSPCAKSDKRVLLIRVPQVAQVSTWLALLNRAACLTLEDIYDIEPGMLGKGQYSTVHKAKRQGGSTTEVAVKLFDKNQFWRLVQKGVERADTIVRECAVQATLTRRRGDLDSFIHLRGFLETSDHIIMEMELLDGTDLFKHISARGVLPEPEAARILAELLRVVVAMNEAGLSHRDIKPANVLMCKNSPAEAQIKLCDFGMAAFAGSDGLVRGRCGTPGYVAPEIFTAGLHGGYGNKVDVFSLGVTLYVCLCGYEPFYGTTDEELIESNRNAELDFPKEDWSAVSPQAISLVKSMMAADPEKRPTAAQVLSDPWIVKHARQETPTPAGEGHADSSCLIL